MGRNSFDILGILIPQALFISPHHLGRRHAAYFAHQKHIQLPILRIRIGHGAEAASIPPAIGGKDHGIISVVALPINDNLVFFPQAPENVFRRRKDIGPLSPAQRQALVFSHSGCHPGIDAHRQHIHCTAAVGFHIIHGQFFPFCQLRQLKKPVHLPAEHLDEIVAGTGREVPHCHIPHPKGSPGRFVQRAVAAAGVKPQMLSAPLQTGLPHQFHPMARVLGDQDLIFQILFQSGLAAHPGQFGLTAPASRRWIDQKDVFHLLFSRPSSTACL